MKIKHTVNFSKRVGRFIAEANKLNHEMDGENPTLVDAKAILVTMIDYLRADLMDGDDGKVQAKIDFLKNPDQAPSAE